MELYPIQIAPNHADHISYYKDKYIDEMLNKECCVAQIKYDGERMLIHIDHGNVWCTSRRISKKTGRYMQNEDRLPYLKELIAEKCKDWNYTVLDCECYADCWSTVAGILHSLPERAKELQDSLDNPVKFAVFDCLFFAGKDWRDTEYELRLEFAKTCVEQIGAPLHVVEELRRAMRTREVVDEIMESAVGRGFEGIVLKSLDRAYYDEGASLKVKKFETVDVVVIDFVPGNGKYSDTIGALRVGYYDPDKDEYVIVSNVNCSTDAERNAWRDNWKEWQYSVIEVKCQEITGKSLRHPRYVRRREDKSAIMCTRDTIFK